MNKWNETLRKIGRATSAFVGVGAFGALTAYSVYSSLYSVPPGCRAIVFSRIDGIKNKVTHFTCFFLEINFLFSCKRLINVIEIDSDLNFNY